MFKIDKNKGKSEYVSKSFRFPPDLAERLQVLAQQEDLSLNRLVIQCCQYALDNLETK